MNNAGHYYSLQLDISSTTSQSLGGHWPWQRPNLMARHPRSIHAIHVPQQHSYLQSLQHMLGQRKHILQTFRFLAVLVVVLALNGTLLLCVQHGCLETKGAGTIIFASHGSRITLTLFLRLFQSLLHEFGAILLGPFFISWQPGKRQTCWPRNGILCLLDQFVALLLSQSNLTRQ